MIFFVFSIELVLLLGLKACESQEVPCFKCISNVNSLVAQ